MSDVSPAALNGVRKIKEPASLRCVHAWLGSRGPSRHVSLPRCGAVSFIRVVYRGLVDPRLHSGKHTSLDSPTDVAQHPTYTRDVNAGCPPPL